VVLIDDDEELLELLNDYLTTGGLEVITAESGKEGLEIIRKEKIDLAVIDIMMPVMDGFELLKVIGKKFPALPVIILTAKSEELDRILGLELGADDYLVKPFSSRELLARIKAIIRRKEKLKNTLRNEIDFEGDTVIMLDPRKRKAIVRGDAIELSSIEFDILKIFIENRGVVLAREKIMDLARGENFVALDRSIDVQISRLRQKIEKNPKQPVLLKTVWGVGYIFTGED